MVSRLARSVVVIGVVVDHQIGKDDGHAGPQTELARA
jgi:hypothetical protein